ncbi:MAG: PQQ-binding-like beta-propeller repeat protein [Gemmataceae bacterium]
MRTVCLLALVPALLAADWPQWRGPNRDSIIQADPWPERLTHLEKSWRVALDKGYPGPIVSKDRVWVAETRQAKDEVVRCLDRATGKQLWETAWPGSMTVPFFARANGSWIRSTPAFDGESLYVAGMRDVLVCLDAATGKVRWRVDFMERYNSPLPAFGFVSSPLVDGDAVYVQAGSSALKLNKKTGETIWRTLKDEGGMFGSAFSSPTFATLAGKRQLLVQTRSTLAGIEPEDGSVLWGQKIPAMRGMNILTPTVYGESVFTSAYGAKTYLFNIHRDSTDSPKMKVTESWNISMEGYMSSPVVIGKHAYLHLRNQRVACVHLETGKTTWTTSKTYGKYWSMIANRDKILALDERGILYLLKANPERFELLDEKKVSDQECWGHLAISGNELFIRELQGISAWKWKN